MHMMLFRAYIHMVLFRAYIHMAIHGAFRAYEICAYYIL